MPKRTIAIPESTILQLDLIKSFLKIDSTSSAIAISIAMMDWVREQTEDNFYITATRFNPKTNEKIIRETPLKIALTKEQSLKNSITMKESTQLI